MSIFNTKVTKIQPAFTFLAIIIIGVILGVYIVDDPRYRASIIILFFIIAFIIAGFELAAAVRMSNQERGTIRQKLTPKEREILKERDLSKFVAELFDEDIPFDEIE